MQDTLAYNGRAVREGILDWLPSLDLPHALTLNTDRALSLTRLGSIFSQACLEIDRVTHGRKNVQSLPSHERFLAIAFPEHLETNAHLHALCNLSSYMNRFPGQSAAVDYLEHAWRRSTRGAGSIHLEDVRSPGFARYALKGVLTADSPYFLSSDFHSQR